MTAPGNVNGEKLATDYLADVTRAALRYLPKGDRLKFVGTTRALIERRCGPLRHAELSMVAAVLAELGEPQDLVKQERARIDAAWARRRAAARRAAGAAAAASPWEQRPITSRWRPATGDRLPRPGVIRRWRGPAGPASGQPPAPGRDAAAGPAPAGWDVTPGRDEAAGPAPAGWDVAPGQDAAAGPAPAGRAGAGPAQPQPEAPPAPPPGPGPGRATGGPAADPAGAAPERPGSNGHGELSGALEPWQPGDIPAGPVIEPTSLVPPARPPLPAETGSDAAAGPPTIPGLPVLAGPAPATEVSRRAGGGPAGPPGALVPLTAAGLATLARSRRREAVAVLLLGAGGLLLPLPFWPLGAAAAGLSRFWEARYKWLALFGPALVWLLLTAPVAAIAGGHGNAVVVYLHALSLDARYLVRLGCAVTAAYLTLVVRRGPRERVPPWRR